MIGYYVHHHGQGHLHRAEALVGALEETVTGLSSLPRPHGWRGPWVQLPRDDAPPVAGDVTAGGRLHWVPEGHPGVRARAGAISAWLEDARPRLVVVDVSVETAVLVRLHAVPVVSVVLPGTRTDDAHLLGYRLSTALVAFSPLPATDLVPGLPADVASRVHSVGAVSRYAPTTTPPRPADRPHAAVLLGRGGGPLPEDAGHWRRLAPGWRWTVAGGGGGWVDDLSGLLRSADVVVTAAGESSLADVAAHRRPAVVVPAERPFAEQATTAGLLARGDWPAVVLNGVDRVEWREVLAHAASLDGGRWRRWCDGRAAERFADVVASVASRPNGLRTA